MRPTLFLPTLFHFAVLLAVVPFVHADASQIHRNSLRLSHLRHLRYQQRDVITDLPTGWTAVGCYTDTPLASEHLDEGMVLNRVDLFEKLTDDKYPIIYFLVYSPFFGSRPLRCGCALWTLALNRTLYLSIPFFTHLGQTIPSNSVTVITGGPSVG